MFNKEKPVELLLDKEKCAKCGTCIEVCSSYLKLDEEGFPSANNPEESLFGCIQCGNCMMICPKDAIEIKGEDIDKEHLRDKSSNIASYDSLNSLFLKRRSIRNYKNQEISTEIFDKIVQAAATAAVSIPPSEIKVLIINGKDKVQEFADDIVEAMKGFVKIMNPISLWLLKIFTGKTNQKMFKEFILPLCKETIKGREDGIDHLFYNAPAVMVFYSTELSDKEDQLIAATHATLAAEALGLGTCFIGSVGALLQNNKKMRKKYGIQPTDKAGTGFTIGYPDIKFHKDFQRNFKEVRYF